MRGNCMKLYIYEHCPFCLRTRMISGLKQLDMQYEVIMEGDAETPTRLVGKKVVPILQLNWESIFQREKIHFQ